YAVTDLGLEVTAQLENRDASVQLAELQLTPVSGARTLSGNPEEEYLAWPNDMGRRVRNPAFADLSVFAGFRKYERHDQFHTDMDALYQSGNASMQWYDWYSSLEGLYCGAKDTTRQALCLHVERDVKLNVLRFGFIRYPMLEAGESWAGQALCFYPHEGDWHAGAKFYRAFMDGEGGFTPPARPTWCQDMTGWLRLIFKQHHGEINWDYSRIPELYDELAAAGFNTLYLLGWEEGGFARMWPDGRPDPRMGGEELLRKGIDYVHGRGGKVLMFLSYALIDRESEFYRLRGGDQATIRSIWGEEIPFAETYCGEGTYRKIANPPMPMYLACPGAPMWHDKMKEAAKTCLDLGADGVLYDIGGWKPFFCYAQGHTHQKPSHSHQSKAANYADLRNWVKSFGEDRIILMEHNVDVYGQSMDVSHGSATIPDRRLLSPATAANPAGARDDRMMLEMYRYTFPELVVTNRECGQDEEHYRAMAGYSFLLGLRFDMTIYRCCGSLSDIPNYTAYLKELNALYNQYADFVLRGTFVDTDGFTCSNPLVFAKGWRGAHG
ncbi:MAG TPA: DUF6259 domain-containing protein, partial [Candidatus Limnocylindria bacterium]|nr:DUF6259 domain-containing protein [Candidatus Limnocylindria bacterium]